MCISDLSSDVCSSDLVRLVNIHRSPSTPARISAAQFFHVHIRKPGITAKKENIPDLSQPLDFKFLLRHDFQFRSIEKDPHDLFQPCLIIQERINREPPVRKANANDLAKILDVFDGRIIAAVPYGTKIKVERADEFVIDARSEEHTSELQSLMRISYA